MVDYEKVNYHFKNNDPREIDEGLQHIKSFQCELKNEEWKGEVMDNNPYEFNLSHEGWGIDTIKSIRGINGIRRLFNYILSRGGNIMIQYEFKCNKELVQEEVFFHN